MEAEYADDYSDEEDEENEEDELQYHDDEHREDSNILEEQDQDLEEMVAVTREELLAREEEKEKRDLYLAAMSFVVMFVCVGLPVWWYTTNIYRASLPYTDIYQLEGVTPTRMLTIHLVFPESQLTKEKFNLGWVMEDRLRVSKDAEQKLWDVSVKVLGMDREMATDVKTAADISNLDDSVGARGREYDLRFIVLPSQSNTLMAKGVALHIGRHRTVYVSSGLTDPVLVDTICDAVQNVLVKQGNIEKIASTSAATYSRTTEKPVKSLMREVKSKGAYDLVFTLIDADPSTHISWNIQTAVEDKLQPFLGKLSKLANFTIESQVLYYARFGVEAKYDKVTKRYYITDSLLPHVINPIESRLGSHLSHNPTLNFIVYVPPASQTPLYIRYERKKGGSKEVSYSSSFLSARWGGVVIYNMNDTTSNHDHASDDHDHDHTSDDHDHTSDDHDHNHAKHDHDHARDVKLGSWVMPLFVSQLRQLLGLEPGGGRSGVAGYDPSLIHLWEVDYLLHRHLISHVMTSASTLTSLSQLLGEIENIVISDDVASHIHLAIHSIHSSLASLKQGRLEEAFHHARTATVASETAFFDPSLLELLYFPEDQKFAIYVPLFIPIGVPVIMSIVAAVKHFKKKRSAGADGGEVDETI